MREDSKRSRNWEKHTSVIYVKQKIPKNSLYIKVGYDIDVYDRKCYYVNGSLGIQNIAIL
jgi:hypothetical protein